MSGLITTAQQRFAADASVNCLGNANCNTGLPVINATNSQLQIILQLAFGIIGALAVITIIIGALYMVTAQGDPQKAARARQTVIFAAVGLAVAVSAEAIIVFVVGRL
jgi:hypothetical protein